jgi:hypothetical protein
LTHGRVDGPIPVKKLAEFEFHNKKMADLPPRKAEVALFLVKRKPVVDNQLSDDNSHCSSVWCEDQTSLEEQPLLDGWVPTRLPRQGRQEVDAQLLRLLQR